MNRYINLDYIGEISDVYLEVKSRLTCFESSELEFLLEEDISNQEIIIFQSFILNRFNDSLLKLQIVCDVLKRNKVKKIILFSPFLPYMRQDKFFNLKLSSGAKLIIDIINYSGIQEVITYDLHNKDIESHFKCKLKNLSMIPIFIQDIKQKYNRNNVLIVFPDIGAVIRYKNFFQDNSFRVTSINKKSTLNKIDMSILGAVEDQTVIIIDDIIDSAKTITEAVKILIENKVKEVYVYATHGIFSNNAIERSDIAEIQNITLSNSLLSSKSELLFNKSNKIKIINISSNF